MSPLNFDTNDVDYLINRVWRIFLFGFPTKENLLEIYEHLVELVSIGASFGLGSTEVGKSLNGKTPPFWLARWTDTWGCKLERLDATITTGDLEDARRVIENMARDLPRYRMN